MRVSTKIMKTPHFALWMLITPYLVAYGNVEYLHKQRDETVNLLCESEVYATPPFGLYLKRKWVQPNSQVLYIHSGDKPTFKDQEADRGRIQVHEDLNSHQVKVNITHLRGADTDLYFCEFVFAQNPVDRIVPGKKEFFLHVNDSSKSPLCTPEKSPMLRGCSCDGVFPSSEPCECTGYQPLLYAISAAVGLLLFIIICLVVAYCRKAADRGKPQPLVPIYEEMTGVRPPKGKASTCHLDPAHLEEAEAAVYVKPASRARRENQYVSPKGILPSHESSGTAGEDQA